MDRKLYVLDNAKGWSMLAVRRSTGFSLVELIITLAIVGIALAAGLPGITEWIRNSQIRTAADDLLGALQTARTEAVRRNAHIDFVLTNPGATGGTGWTIQTTVAQQVIQSSPDGVGTRNVVLAVSPAGATTVTFNGFGRPTGGLEQVAQIDLDSAVLAADKSRDLRIVITTGGEIRMCDPNVVDTLDPRRC